MERHAAGPDAPHPETFVEQTANGRAAVAPQGLLRVLYGILLHPARFYEALGRHGDAERFAALKFLVLCALASSLLGWLLLPERKPVLLAAFLLNALLTPLVLTALLRPVTAVLCRGGLRSRDLFRITAYAHVTLLFSWIPGLAAPAGIWKLALMGTGLARVGRTGAARALAALALMFGILLAAIRFIPLPAGF